MLTLLMTAYDNNEWGSDAPTAYALPLTSEVLGALQDDINQVKQFASIAKRTRYVEFSDRWGYWIDGEQYDDLLDNNCAIVADIKISDDIIHPGLDLPSYCIWPSSGFTFVVCSKHGGSEYYTETIDWDWLMEEVARAKEGLIWNT